MPEPITETTQTEPITATTGQGTVGEPAQTPSKKDEQTAPAINTATTTSAPASTATETKLPQAEVQKRVDRMYARLQEERKRRVAAEALSRPITPTPETDDGDEAAVDTKPVTTSTFTERDVEVVLERKEREKKFMDSEIRVFEQHPDALNEDGTFNMSSVFVQKYVDIGRRNPMLVTMENGPEMAAALADKELGLDFKKGRSAEATRLASQPMNTFTTTSTTAIPPAGHTAQLNEVQKKIARRMGISDKDYLDSQESNKVKQKSWEVKVR